MSDVIDDYFDYNNFDLHFKKSEVEKAFQSINKNYIEIVKNWDSNLNSQWVARDYIAVKMILATTVLLNSVEYAKEKNLRIVEPYLLYYSLLNCSRAVVLTSPLSEWNNKEIFTMTHKKTINVVGDVIAKFNKKKSKEIKGTIDWAREYREIFSYKFPANGLTNHNLDIENVISVCQLLCEIAQFQSKILENLITKRISVEYELDWEVLNIGYEYGETNFSFFDEEDGYRLNYITRKQKRPYSLHLTMTEGMVEDFFGAWCPTEEDDSGEQFDPDKNWQIIFPVP